MRVFVTGGAGFIGSQLVRDLLDKGYEVSALDDFSTGCPENIQELREKPGFKFYQGNICDSLSVSKALDGCDAVMHLAVSNLRISIENPRISHDTNASGTLNILECCRKQNIRRFIYVSSSEIYGTAEYVPMDENHPLRPTTVYASSKLAGEYYTLSYSKMYGMNTTVIRPFNNYGPRSHYEKQNGEIIPRTIVRLLNGLPPLIFGDGTQTRDFTYVTDTARALIAVLEHNDVNGEIFNFATGIEISMSTLCNELCKTINPKLKPIYENQGRPGDVKRHLADVSKFKKRFNMAPEIALEKGLQLYVNWFKNQEYNLPQLLSTVPNRNW